MIKWADNTLWLAPIFLIILAGMTACHREQNPTRFDRIVLITLDTLRADHLSCYGYPRKTSPFIDSLASGGTIFRNTFSPMPSTVPSHASIFTSLYPIQINVIKNGHRLEDSFITMAEEMREAGYNTAAFVSTNQHFTPGNLLQGFEYVNRPDLSSDELYRPADKVVDDVITWLENTDPGDRFFLWLHFYDTHSPYYPPEKYLDMFAEMPADQRESFARYLLEERHLNPDFYPILPDDYLRDTIHLTRYGGERGDGRETMMRIIDAYDGEVRFLDYELERLFRFFKEQGLNKNLLWVITSDHGEGLGNHWWLEHEKYLYDEQIRVPLIFYSPTNVISGQAITKAATLVDIFPTLAELTGIPLFKEITESHGISWARLLTLPGPRPVAGSTTPRYTLAQRRDYQGPDSDDPISPDKGYEGEIYSLQNGQYKYILSTAYEDEFYDLQKDRYEANNLVNQGGEIERELRTKLIAILNQLKTGISGTPVLVDESGIKKLKTLGYIQ